MDSMNLSFGQKGVVVLKKGIFKRVLESHVDVETTDSEAWNLLMDFESWHKWNQFIPIVNGRLKVGEALEIVVKSPGMKEMVFKPIVFDVQSKKSIVWGGGSLFKGYRGMHHFIIEKIDDRSIRFKQIEIFEGLLVMFIGKMILKTAKGYAMMNDMFKNALESKNNPVKDNYIWEL